MPDLSSAADRAEAAATQMFGCPPLGADDAPAGAEDHSGFSVADPPPEKDDERIARLAKMPMLAYEKVRVAEAKAMRMRPTILDKLAAAARGDGEQGAPGQGRTLRIERAEPWPDSVAGAELLDALAIFIRRHLFLPDGTPDALAVWVVHTYCFTRFRHTPRVALTSPEKRCGKTTVLEVLEVLVASPLSTSNITSAALFRTIELAKPTLLIDEADSFLGDNDDLRGAINAGHKRGGQVIRCVGDDAEPRQFSVFAPVVIAAIGKLGRLGTIEDRSLIVRMQRATRAERPAAFDAKAETEGMRLARMCARWADDHGARLASADPVLPVALFNRAADNWRCLFAIAEAAGGDWPARLTAASCKLMPDDDDNESRGIRLLADIKAVFDDGNLDVVASAALVAALVAIEGAPWAELNHGKPLTQNSLARLLRQYRITSGTVRLGEGSKDTPKGYKRAAFADAWRRYLDEKAAEPPNKAPQRHNPQKPADSAAFKAPQAESLVALCMGEKPQSPAACGVVAVDSGVPPDDANGADGDLHSLASEPAEAEGVL
jgi:hypothetical protein